MIQTHIDLNESIFSLCTKHPELVTILGGLGFTDITKPGMLQNAGRFMTPVKGATLKHIALDAIVEALDAHGFLATY